MFLSFLKRGHFNFARIGHYYFALTTITFSMKAASLSLCTVIENIGKTIVQSMIWAGKIIFNTQRESNLSGALKELANSVACVFLIVILSFCTLFSPQILCKFYDPRQQRFQPLPFVQQRLPHGLETQALHVLLEEAHQGNQALVEQIRILELYLNQKGAEYEVLSKRCNEVLAEGELKQDFLIQLREECTRLKERVRELEGVKVLPKSLGDPDRRHLAAALEKRGL